MDNKELTIDEWIKKWKEECEKKGLTKPVPLNKTGAFIRIIFVVYNEINRRRRE